MDTTNPAIKDVIQMLNSKEYSIDELNKEYKISNDVDGVITKLNNACVYFDEESTEWTYLGTEENKSLNRSILSKVYRLKVDEPYIQHSRSIFIEETKMAINV